MNIFDKIDEGLFGLLTSKYKRNYVDILMLIWEQCKKTSTGLVEKNIIVDMVENYICKLDEKIEFEDDTSQSNNANDARMVANSFIRDLRKAGWLIQKEAFAQEVKIAINYKIEPIIQAFNEITSQKSTSYKGQLFKIYSIFKEISKQNNPYEDVLKEASQDFEKLNQSLKKLDASIEDYIQGLVQGKTPQEILKLFEHYGEYIVKRAYHNFKTSDNLYFYKESLLDGLDKCEGVLFDVLVLDYMNVEQVSKERARKDIKDLISKFRYDIDEMKIIIENIDEKHRVFREKSILRANFLLYCDGSVKSKINNILKYYVSLIDEKNDLYSDDDSVCADMIKVFSTNYIDNNSLSVPTKKRENTVIEPIMLINKINEDLIEQKHQKLRQYMQNALTLKNINKFALEILEDKTEILASSILENTQNALAKVIGLYVYSKTFGREYEIVLTNDFVECGGVSFRNFILQKRIINE